ncbi:MAG: IPT/TIG domain-containing protein, partial [Planctomycetota bacterium]
MKARKRFSRGSFIVMACLVFSLSACEKETNTIPWTQPMVISGLAPDSGPMAGGTTVQIFGVGFDTAGATVNFGGIAATSVVVNSSTHITCDTPAGSSGYVDVALTSGGGAYTLNSGFLYLGPPPDLVSIDVASGPEAGGTSVTL